jgi:RNA polymerase sigma-70 factor, ECF subfamily
MQPAKPGEITVLLQNVRKGDSEALDRLLPLVLHELHQLARHYLSAERPGHTLQPTALVNEAYLRLMSDQARDWRNRAHFVGVTAGIMRRILIDHARRKQTLKRSAERESIELCEELDAGLSSEQAEELLALDKALERMESVNPRHRQVVELRCFGGLSLEETAEALNVSLITVKRDWRAARAWLKGQVRPGSLDQSLEQKSD